MSQSVQDLSLPVSSTAPATALAAPDAPADSEPDESPDSVLRIAAGSTAVGYYLSTLLHLLAYGGAAIVFTYVGQILQEDDVVTPLRASLDDMDREADQPRFEIVPDVSLGESEGQSEVERLANNLKIAENGLIETLNSDAIPSLMANQDDALDDSGASDFLFKLPESGLAVTKGSFTVWTEPEHPRTREPYMIIIEVRLREGSRVYRVNDLSGYVIGSDGYKQKIPVDVEAPNNSFYTDEDKRMQKLSSSKQIKVRNDKVPLAIKVPGANRLVKDTIQIRSRRLRERQELELVFGK